MKAGVAFSNDSDPGQAGREAAQQAVAESGSPVFPILFTTDAYAPEAVLNAVKKEIGESKLVGFCCGGIITSEGVQLQGVGLCTLGGSVIVSERCARILSERLTDFDHYLAAIELYLSR